MGTCQSTQLLAIMNCLDMRGNREMRDKPGAWGDQSRHGNLDAVINGSYVSLSQPGCVGLLNEIDLCETFVDLYRCLQVPELSCRLDEASEVVYVEPSQTSGVVLRPLA